MNVEAVKKENLTQQALLDIAAALSSPTPEAMIGRVQTASEGKNLGLPFSAQEKQRVAYKERASASKFNKLFETIIEDLNTLYDTLALADTNLFRDFDKVRTDMGNLEKRIDRLLSRADSILLKAPQTSGLLGTFIDDFRDATYIDLAETTAQVDTSAQTVYGAFTAGTFVDQDIDLSRINDSDISVTPLDPSSRRDPGTRDSTLRNMITEDQHPWIYTLSRENPKLTGIQVIIDFAKASPFRDEPLRINKIGLGLLSSGYPSTVTLQYSVDGEIWSFFEDNKEPRRISGKASFLFPQTEFRYIRLVLLKDTHDRLGPLYYYDFGIDNIELTSVKNLYKPESELLTTQLFPPSPPGRTHLFSKVLLEVCENIPPGTAIDYYIAALTPIGDGIGEEIDPYTQGDFLKIIPESRQTDEGPKILDFSTDPVESQSLTIDLDNIDGEDLNLYRLISTGITKDTLRNVWRNVGSKDTWKKLYQFDGTLTEPGWSKEDRFYVSYGYVSDTNGQTIDFGPNKIVIDDNTVSGKVFLHYGVHRFKVSEENWYSLSGLTRVTNLTGKVFTGTRKFFGATGLGSTEDSENDYSVIDPLYPFNHKALIEGLTYHQTFEGPQTYKGLSFFAGHLMSLVSEEDFRLDPKDDKFCLVRQEDEITSDLLVRWDTRDTEPKETFKIEIGSVGQLAGVVLKMVLRTIHDSKTPSIEGYEIRVI